MDLTQARASLKAELVAKYGEAQRGRIERGVDQVAALWRAEDGDFATFVRDGFLTDPKEVAGTAARLESTFEQLDGNFNELGRSLRWATDVDVGPLLKIDPMLSALDPSAHVTEDLFRSKIGFLVLLNYPLTTLEERLAKGPGWSREEWAQVRLASRFAWRVPAEIAQRSSQVGSEADLYIAEYNVWMHHVLGADGARLFPKGLRLISHWNLRDELKACYADQANGLAKQRILAKVMERIVTQSIPAVVIDNPHVDWDPFANTVTPAPAAEVEPGAPARAGAPSAVPEPDTRYAKWLAQFHAAREVDPYTPITPSLIARRFDVARELPEARVVGMLTQVLSSPLVPKVAAEIERRLGRKLEPVDLWFNGFQARGKYAESELDGLTRKRYPSPQAFAADIPRMLQQLGFTAERAKFLSEHIAVDPARGAGHAMQAMRRGDLARLRTRIAKEGMDYKGYNVAIHELGHNVEQVISLYDVDHTLLSGVPNTAFTEAFAFVFQARDLELLGLSKPDAEVQRLKVLNSFWQTFEIAGVAIVDVRAWHWLYEHPEATPAQFRDAVVQIAKDVWNTYYAPVLGGGDSVLPAIYSHLIAYPLYTPDYPMGHLIAFQIEEHLKKSAALGPEMERMAKYGSVAPDLWMNHATGAPVNADALLRATEAALAGK